MSSRATMISESLSHFCADENELEYEFKAGLMPLHDNRVSVWDSSLDDDEVAASGSILPLSVLSSSVKLRRRLYTPPNIRQRIRAIEMSRQIVVGACNSSTTPSHITKSRGTSGDFGRVLARRTPTTLTSNEGSVEDRKTREKRKDGVVQPGGSYHARLGANAMYMNTNRASPEELEIRRAAALKQKQERGEVVMLRKKPLSPPKSGGGRSASRGGRGGSSLATKNMSDGSPPAQELLPPEDLVLMQPQQSTNHAPTPRPLTLTDRLALSDSLLQEQYQNYFGIKAKENLMLKFKRASHNLEIMPKDSDVPGELRSPRFMYMREVQKGHLLPLPLTVRNTKNPRGIFLAGKGLGDARVLPIVMVADTLPAVETIDLSDNRMTDLSIMPLTLKLPALTTLMHLDLSFNKMDESSESIMKYISSKDCTLRTLKLNGADVDDYECCNLCDAMIENRSIETLCLSKNFLGRDEHKRLLAPKLLLAGDGIAKMLCQNKKLTYLDLSWNSLRMAGAVAVGNALRKNKSLLSLKLQFNSFGDQGTQAVGYALKYNRVLQDLDLSNNSIVPRSTCVLANALSHNHTLKYLNISDNILGRVGSQAVVAAIQRTQDEITPRMISFSSCDCTREDSSLFDPAKPQGRWILDLSEPYGQMIVEECFFLANFRAGCSVERLEYNGREVVLERKNTGGQKFSLSEMQKNSKLAAKNIIAKNFEAAVGYLGDVLRPFGFKMLPDISKNVCKAVGKNWEHRQRQKDRTEDLHEIFLTEVFFALFSINDADHSESMDVNEFISTLDSLGMPGCDLLTAKRLMDEHDKDRSGAIDGSEFAMIMVHEFCRGDQPRGTLVEKQTSKPWPTPSSGSVILDVKFVIDSASAFDVGSDGGISTLIQGMVSARTSEQKDVLFQQACTSPYFFFSADQAQQLLDAALGAGLTMMPLDMIIAILPQIVNEEQTNRFLDQNLNAMGKLALRVKMGPLYNAFVGLPTGHYIVDLKKTLDRMGSKRLAAVSVREARDAKVAGANLSQKGNGTNFRNEMLGQNLNVSVPMAVSGQWFADLPASGELRFDYVSTKRVLVGTLPLSSGRLRKFVERLGLKSIMENMELAEGFMTRIDEAEGLLHAATREASYRVGKKTGDIDSMREVMKIHALKQNLQNISQSVNNEPCMKIHPPLSVGGIKEQFNEFMVTSHHFLDILPKERQRDVSRMNYNPDPNFRPPTPDVLFRGEVPEKRKMSAIYPYAYRKMLELQIEMPGVFLSASQAVQLMNYFPEEGYLRVQVLLAIFSHIIDAENICLDIYDKHCSLNERLEIIHRLGVLAVMDPMKPDREYCLDLRHYDQREWAKVLISLALNEPGDNWVDGGEYRWSRYDDPVPGWILPQPWTLPDDSDGGEGGPRRYGWLRVTYTSTAKGCEPSPQVRRNLRRKTLAGQKTLL